MTVEERVWKEKADCWLVPQEEAEKEEKGERKKGQW